MWFTVILGVIVIAAVLGVWFAYSSLPGRFERWVQRLTDTGSVEGTLFINGRPAPAGVPVACGHVYIEDESEGSFGIDQKCTETREDGQFHFRFIPAGEAGVGRQIACCGRLYSEADRRVEVRAGETTHVVLGAGRGQVRGRMLLPEGIDMPDNWDRYPPVWLVCVGPAPGVDDKDQVVEYSGEWRFIGGEYGPVREDYHRWRFVPVAPDGTFVVSGVHPGEYVLSKSVNEDDEWEWDIDWCALIPVAGPVAHVIRTVVVPPAGESGIAEVDMGDVSLHAKLFEKHGKGGVRGTVYIDGVLAPEGTTVDCALSGVRWDFSRGDTPETMGNYFMFTVQAQTGADGRFSVPSLPAGKARVEWQGDDSESEEGEDFIWNMVEAVVVAGETAEVRLDCATRSAGTAVERG